MLKDFKIRCSAIGKIMTNPRNKKDILSKTCISYLELWVKEQLYERRKEIKSKYFEKGNSCENDSIDFIAEELGYFMLEKNTERKEDDYKTGECDINAGKTIIDVKNSFDFTTFPLYQTEIDKDYFLQGQGYMSLWGADNYKLCYTLMDMPVHMIESEFNKFCYTEGCERTEDVFEYVRKQHTYSNLDSKLRLKVFEFERDNSIIEAINERVLLCREYILEHLTVTI